MKAKTVQCPLCTTNFTVDEQIGGKLSFALGGVLLGAQAMKSPFAILLFGAIGLVVGHYIDTEVRQLTANCPQCGQLLTIAAAVI